MNRSKESLIAALGKAAIMTTYPMRAGQAIFICLERLEPELAQHIKATEIDPFYDDSAIPKLFEYINNLEECE